MPDPVLNRPMFQGSTPSAPSAKGTGITSMVTPPDVAAEQLRSVVNPMKPIVQGFADGGFAGFSDALNAYNAFLNSSEGKADNAVRTDTNTPLGAYAQQTGSNLNSGLASLYNVGNQQQADQQKVFNTAPASQTAARTALMSSTPQTASSPSLGKDSYDIFKSGIVPTQSSSGSPAISGKGVIIQTYAEGGPVQGFADGGPATSMWQRFVQSLTVPEPDRSGTYRLPDVGLRMGQSNDFRREAGIRSAGSAPEYVEPMDVGGRDAIISPEVYADVTRPTMEERRAEAKRNIESYEAPPPHSTPIGRGLQSLFGQDEAGVAAAKQQAQEVSDAALARDEALKKREQLRAEYERATNQNPVSVSDYFSDMSDAELAQKREDRRIAQEAVMRQVRPEEYIARGDSNPADLGGAGIRSLRGTGQLPPVVNIDEGKKTEPQRQATSDVGLNLQQIKADREAKSSADRRENALLALMNAGFAMAAGKSPHALQNIGAGGQAGVQAFAEMEKGRRDSEYRQAVQDLHERELRMRQAEQDIKAPLYKAQAAYWTARPDIEADKIAAAERRIVSRAEADAQKAVDSLEAKNPMVFMGPNGKVDTIAKEAAKAKYLAQYKRQYEDYYKAGIPNAGGGLGLDLPGTE